MPKNKTIQLTVTEEEFSNSFEDFPGTGGAAILRELVIYRTHRINVDRSYRADICGQEIEIFIKDNKDENTI